MSGRDARRELEDTLFELIGRTSCDLPSDVRGALKKGLDGEVPGSGAAETLRAIFENIRLARRHRVPLCQDTGTLNFFARLPAGMDPQWLRRRIERAVAKATRQGFLRRNTFDYTGRSFDDNRGPGAPQCYFEFRSASPRISIRLLMKGGGCENCGAQYSLPEESLRAGRDLDGVRRCILDAAWRAQGRGCAPGILGVCVGGDRAAGAFEAKRQLLRRVNDSASDPRLADLEQRALREIQSLGIGPMGMGGRTTALGVKIGALSRLPASFFVTVSYMCWACRRRGVEIHPDGTVFRWTS